MRRRKKIKLFLVYNDTHKRVAPSFFMPLPGKKKFKVQWFGNSIISVETRRRRRR
jgi:hypothetical protein